jgi:hypothetical protein
LETEVDGSSRNLAHPGDFQVGGAGIVEENMENLLVEGV